MIWKLIKLLIYLALLGAFALAIYAYVGPVFFPADFAADPVVQRVPVNLGGQ